MPRWQGVKQIVHASIAERDKKHFMHPFTSLKGQHEGTPQCMDRAEAIYIHDTQGRTFIDAIAGLW